MIESASKQQHTLLGPELQRPAGATYPSLSRALHQLGRLINSQAKALTDERLLELIDAPEDQDHLAKRVRLLRSFLREPREKLSHAALSELEQVQSACKSQLLAYALLAQYANHTQDDYDDTRLVHWAESIQSWPAEDRLKAEKALLKLLPFIQVMGSRLVLQASAAFALLRPDAIGQLLRRHCISYQQDDSWQLKFVLLVPGGLQSSTGDMWDNLEPPSSVLSGPSLLLNFLLQQAQEWRDLYCLRLFKAAFCDEEPPGKVALEPDLFQIEASTFLHAAFKTRALDSARLDPFLKLPHRPEGAQLLLNVAQLSPFRSLSENTQQFAIEQLCAGHLTLLDWLLKDLAGLETESKSELLLRHAPDRTQLQQFLTSLPSRYHADVLKALILRFDMTRGFADALRLIFPKASLGSLQQLQDALRDPSVKNRQLDAPTITLMLDACRTLDEASLKLLATQSLYDAIEELRCCQFIFEEGPDWAAALSHLSLRQHALFEELFVTALITCKHRHLDPARVRLPLLFSEGFYGQLLRKHLQGISCSDVANTPWTDLYLARNLHSGIDKGLQCNQIPDCIPLSSTDRVHTVPSATRSALLYANLELIQQARGEARWQQMVPLITAAACSPGTLSSGIAALDSAFLQLLHEGLKLGKLELSACQSVLHSYLQTNGLICTELDQQVAVSADEGAPRIPQLLSDCAFAHQKLLPQDWTIRESVALSDWLYCGRVPQELELRSKLAELSPDARDLLLSNDCPRLVSPYACRAFKHVIPL